MCAPKVDERTNTSFKNITKPEKWKGIGYELGYFHKPSTKVSTPTPASSSATTESMLRELSRAETDNQIRTSRRSMMYGGGSR